RVELEHRESRVQIDNHARQTVAFTVDEAKAVGLRQLGQRLAKLERALDAIFEELDVNRLARISRQDPHGDRRERIVVSAGYELALLGDVHHAAGRKLRRPLQGLAQDPGMDGTQVPRPAFGQLQANQAPASDLAAGGWRPPPLRTRGPREPG